MAGGCPYFWRPLIIIFRVALVLVIGGGISDVFTGVGNELEREMA